METSVTAKSHKILALNTFAFTVCFAAWMINGVLVSYLSSQNIFQWGPKEIGWLLGIPVLSGSIFRLPVGILTDKYGGKYVFGILLLLSAIPMYLLGYSNNFVEFALCSLGFGLTGTGFAVGIAYTSVWYPKNWQGTALGIFGAGNAGAAITTLFAPTLLKHFTNNGLNPDGWRSLPVYYSIALLFTGLLFFIVADNKVSGNSDKSLKKMLEPLKSMRVWRFSTYYFLVFGCFVALSQWLVNYYLNNYEVSLVMAGMFASIFSLPSGVIRALGGWMSDKFGARKVMYWVLGLSITCCVFLFFPKMEVITAGPSVNAKAPGLVETISDTEITVNGVPYKFTLKAEKFEAKDTDLIIWPKKNVWQEPVVKVGDKVNNKQILAKGKTRIFFQANIYIATFFILILGIVWGVGKAAVYKYIPEYFPNDVGVVGGIVGVIGGLGGFVAPILFGYMLEFTGLWTSMWFFLALFSVLCLLWLHSVVKKITLKETKHLQTFFETKN